MSLSLCSILQGKNHTNKVTELVDKSGLYIVKYCKELVYTYKMELGTNVRHGAYKNEVRYLTAVAQTG